MGDRIKWVQLNYGTYRCNYKENLKDHKFYGDGSKRPLATVVRLDAMQTLNPTHIQEVYYGETET